MTAVWACPHCKDVLSSATNTLTCANGHMFDRAKQGYVNLLPANKKRSLEPGDNADMIDARKAFLTGGHYDFLMSAIAQKIAAHLETYIKGCVGDSTEEDVGESTEDSTEKSTKGSIERRTDRINNTEPLLCLDLGCGEGSYLQHIAKANSKYGIEYYGLDISKFAVKRAASLFKQVQSDLQRQRLGQESQQSTLKLSMPKPANFAVASSYDIPMLDNSVDVVLSVFAPVSSSEISRVLKPGGVLMRITPGMNHLMQLKQAIYTQATPHEQPKSLIGSKVVGQYDVSQQAELSPAELSQLIAMTPLGWRGSRVAKEDLLATDAFTIDFDFVIQVMCFEQ